MKPIKILLEPKNRWLSLALGWTLTVLFLCLANNESLPSLELQVSGVDKVVHAMFHFIYTFLWAMYAKASRQTWRSVYLSKIAFSSFLFGLAIEIAQGLFTVTRTADWVDVVANVTGAVLALLFIRFWFKET